MPLLEALAAYFLPMYLPHTPQCIAVLPTLLALPSGFLIDAHFPITGWAVFHFMGWFYSTLPKLRYPIALYRGPVGRRVAAYLMGLVPLTWRTRTRYAAANCCGRPSCRGTYSHPSPPSWVHPTGAFATPPPPHGRRQPATRIFTLCRCHFTTFYCSEYVGSDTAFRWDVPPAQHGPRTPGGRLLSSFAWDCLFACYHLSPHPSRS